MALRSRRTIGIGAVAALLLAILVPILATRSSAHTSQQLLAGVPEGATPVALDTTLYIPSHTPAPAVLLAHGFGGDKNGVDSTAKALAKAGYVVLAYTARGFGQSGGLIHLDSLDYEVKDASKMVDFLATRPEVERKNGQPRVGVAGASYGGALALMLAGTDKRIEAVAADVTWNDLTKVFFPNNAGENPGVWKKLWAGALFSEGVPRGSDPTCGRFALDICHAYQLASVTGRPDATLLALLHNSSPATVAANITAPVLLSQGEQDSLFPLSEADANARQIEDHGAPVRMIWRSGGHDTGTAIPEETVVGWFDEAFTGHVRPQFQAAQLGSHVSAQTGQADELTLTLDKYPAPDKSVRLPVAGPPQLVAAPAGGAPAAITTGPGLGALAAASSAVPATSVVNGQTASFCSAPLANQVLMGGSGSVDLNVQGPPDATLFVSVRDLSPSGLVLPSGLVAPIRLPAPGRAHVQVPWIVHSFGAGHQICVEVGTTDTGYFLPSDPRNYVVSIASPLTVSTIASSKPAGGHPWGWILTGLVAIVATAVAVFATRLRPKGLDTPPFGRHSTNESDEAAAPPVVVDGLVKEYADGYRAVDGVSFQVEAGQVVGLLGPNGAGKTTTLRVLVGLIRPTTGEVRVFGKPIRPGDRVLSRLGAFIEGPGFLPHLSGRDNLRLYWATTGRPKEDAHFDVALDIAGLGASVDRRVKSYSHGMRQRLGIAQAMLGLPDVLVLDEPTNGLDPPQIAEMREVMRAYARTGRTVVVSSHLLAEVEQTCTHVVVMHKGKLVAAGSVSDIAGLGSTALMVADPKAATEVLKNAGIEATEVPIGRALEDVFLHLVGEDE